jgi:hypothetical protein
MLVKIVTVDTSSLLPDHDRLLLHSNVWCSVSHTKIEHITYHNFGSKVEYQRRIGNKKRENSRLLACDFWWTGEDRAMMWWMTRAEGNNKKHTRARL